MKTFKRLFRLGAVVLALMCAVSTVAEAAVFYSYSYDNDGNANASPDGASPVKTVYGDSFAGGSLSSPQDICIHGDKLYIADTKNNRIVVTDTSFADASIIDSFERGGKGGVGLAHKVIEALGEARSNYHPLYELKMPLKAKIEKIAKEIYRSGKVEYSETAEKKIEECEKRGYGDFYVCMAKTPNSLSDDPKLLGVPEGNVLHIRDVELAKGARFVIPLAGSILRMPGLPKVPAAIKMEDEPW